MIHPFDMLLISILFFESLIMAVFLCYTLERKYSVRKTLTVNSLIFISVILITYADYSNILMRQCIHYLSIFLACRILYNGSWKQKLFSVSVINILTILCDMSASIVTYTIFSEVIGNPVGIFLLIGNLIFLAFYLPSASLLLFFWKKYYGQVSRRSIYATYLFPVSQFFLFEVFIYYITLQLILHRFYTMPLVCAVIGSLLCVVADVLLFRIILTDSQTERMAAQLEMMNLQTCRELEYYHFIDEKMREIRTLRHDFGSRLQAVYDILKDDGSEQETETLFWGKLADCGEQMMFPCFCENIIVNVVLEEKSRMAVKQGVALQTALELPEELFVEKADLSSIFSNLLDNAIHAASRITGDRCVCVSASVSETGCAVSVTNPFSEIPEAAEISQNRLLAQRPPVFMEELGWEMEDHGYGLCILRSIAEKYHGRFAVQKEQGKFTAVLELKPGGKIKGNKISSTSP